MEAAGVKIDTQALSRMSAELAREIATKEKAIHEAAGMEFNIGSPKQLGDVLFNRMNLPKPVKYGKGRTISTAVDVLEELAENHPIARMVLDYRQLTKLKSTYVDALPALIRPATGRLHTTFGQTGNGDRTAVFGESESAEHSDPHRTWDAAFARRSSPSPAVCCSPRIIPRSSCGCWPTSRAIRYWSRLISAVMIFTR